MAIFNTKNFVFLGPTKIEQFIKEYNRIGYYSEKYYSFISNCDREMYEYTSEQKNLVKKYNSEI